MSTRTENSDALSLQLKKLLAEVASLQAILADRQSKDLGGVVAASYKPYNSKLFPLVYESTYLVKDGLLYTTVPGKAVSPTASSLFTLFVDTVGEENVAKYVREWRVFYKPESDLGAFVEYMPNADAWLIGVNREEFVVGDSEVTAFYTNLYIHEFSHILLFEKSNFEKTFRQQFWTTADKAHEVKVEKMSPDDRFEILNKYYQNNTTRFVSDYATLSSSEDLAETFLEFVREEKPRGTTVRDQKIQAFYNDADLVSIRKVLRANLIALDAL